MCREPGEEQDKNRNKAMETEGFNVLAKVVTTSCRQRDSGETLNRRVTCSFLSLKWWPGRGLSDFFV